MLFDGVFGHELEYLHAAVLPDAVHAVCRLVFFRRIPPAVIVDHDRGHRQINADAGGKKRCHKDLAVGIFAKTAELFAAVARRALDCGKTDSLFLQIALR